MNLKQYLKDNYGSQYKFCIEKGLQPSKVNYWCSKDWERLNYTTRQKIKQLLNK